MKKEGFKERLQYDKILKEVVKSLFEEFLKESVCIKEIGQEQIILDIHEHVRFKKDITTEFVRFMPDLFVCWKENFDRNSLLIELKCALTGLQKEDSTLIKNLRKKYPNFKKEEIINIELSSWNNLLRLKKMEINVYLFVYAKYHPCKWLIIYPSEELNLLEYYLNKPSKGSGTPIANIYAPADKNHTFRQKNMFNSLLIGLLSNFTSIIKSTKSKLF
ncbi:hypothetical protein [Thermodesulfobacterium thermophilum]|uniref:hypothetical protein n=1 Tax=Thermodesulfobacterium thermophilum TaxID=886 RepID=UPI0003B59159|nr:hypothetical protein [Thermodesulfobacterium thermophilum]